jgi:hypothetical protein
MSTWKHHLVTLLAVSATWIGTAAPAAAQARQGRWTYSFHVGSAHPLGAMDSLNDANIHVDIDFSYRFGDRMPTKGFFNLKLYAALNQFTAEPFVAFAHQRWTNLSVNLQWVLPPIPSGLRPYLQFGPGIYWPKSGPSKTGLNVGIGAQIPIAPFALEFGIDIHQIQTKPVTRFATMQLGVLFH